MYGILSFIANNSLNTSNSTHNVTHNATSILTAQAPAVSLLYTGIESFLFPFLLVFAIVYGVLERSNIFQGKKDIESIIAFVLGIVFATTNYTLQLTYIILPIAAVIVVIVFMMIIIASTVYEGNMSNFPKNARLLIAILSVIIAIGLILWVVTAQNFAFAGLSSSAATHAIETYAPYIGVFIFLIVLGIVAFK